MAADEQTQSGRQQQILLVEDHKATQLLISSLLEKRGYKVTVANHGHEALEILDSSEQIQFVLSDWVMPKMDGVELCKRLKSTNYNRYIFFVLLSSQDDKDSIISGIDAGADDFVAKNTAIDELDARIRAGFRNLNLHIELLTKNQQLDQAYATIRGDLDSAGDFIRQLLPRKTAFNQAQMAYVSMPSAQIGGISLAIWNWMNSTLACILSMSLGMVLLLLCSLFQCNRLFPLLMAKALWCLRSKVNTSQYALPRMW